MLKQPLPIYSSIQNNGGFTLVEIMVVIVIVAILATIALPPFSDYIEKTKKVVCDAKCLQLESMYHTHLLLQGIEHSERVFTTYKDDNPKYLCPDNGTIVMCLAKSNVIFILLKVIMKVMMKVKQETMEMCRFCEILKWQP